MKVPGSLWSKHPEITRAKLIKANGGKNAYNWKGKNACYVTKHGWIHRRFGKAVKCENTECIYPRKNRARRTVLKPRRFEWANKSGKYLRMKSDWMQLCPSCHRKRDLGIIKVKI